MMHIDDTARFQLIRNVDALKDSIDILITDAPAGASENALSFVAASQRPRQAHARRGILRKK
jgi:flagellar biosynthesis protein FlhG